MFGLFCLYIFVCKSFTYTLGWLGSKLEDPDMVSMQFDAILWPSVLAIFLGSAGSFLFGKLAFPLLDRMQLGARPTYERRADADDPMAEQAMLSLPKPKALVMQNTTLFKACSSTLEKTLETMQRNDANAVGASAAANDAAHNGGNSIRPETNTVDEGIPAEVNIEETSVTKLSDTAGHTMRTPLDHALRRSVSGRTPQEQGIPCGSRPRFEESLVTATTDRTQLSSRTSNFEDSARKASLLPVSLPSSIPMPSSSSANAARLLHHRYFAFLLETSQNQPLNFAVIFSHHFPTADELPTTLLFRSCYETLH